MKNTKILSKIGLGETESTIYLDLLQSGSSNIVEISARTKLNRPIIYKTIPYLIESGLISKTLKGKRNHYVAESPEYLKNLFDSLSKRFNTMIPELQEIYDNHDSKPTIKVLEGRSGIRQVFEDIVMTLGKGETYYRYSSRINDFKDSQPLERYKELRNKKQIQRMVITNEIKARSSQSRLDKEVVCIPEGYDLFDQNITKIIYANKVAVIDYNTSISIIMENRILANFEEKIFKTLYKFLKKFEENQKII